WREGDHVVTELPRGPFDPTRWARADYGLLELDPYFRAQGARRLDYCSSRWPWPALPGPAGEVAPLEWSALSPERVVAEMRELGLRLRPDEVAFQDDDLFADPRRAEAIARGLLEAGVRIAWSASGRAAALARFGAESFRALAASGCVRVHVRTPGETPLPGDAAEAILETARRLQAAGIGARFSFRAGFPGQGTDGLAAIHRLACTLRRMDARFETPIRLHAPFPGGPGSNPAGFRVPERLEEWAEAGLEIGGPWIPAGLRRRAQRYHFFLSEAYRPPARRWGKRLLRLVARGRVLLGFYGLDVERHAVEWSARLRTGRDRGPTLADD
ncbi:MAG TPA: radical SAM protein, partial [Actinomycetota bacterium]|nr:radical SAM protein [Actinomycetota bacterium]